MRYRIVGVTYDGVRVLAPKTKSTKFTMAEMRSAIRAAQAARADAISHLKGPTPMMPKVTLRAIDGVGGTIHASKSGAVYEHDADGIVIVDQMDVVDLLATHERVPAERGVRAADAPQVTAVSVTSTTEGASALNPADRMKNTREVPNDAGQQNQDHGDATPPHGDPQNDGSTDASRAEAQAEVDAAKRAGVDTEHRSALANTGHMGVAHPNDADQAEARGEDAGSEHA